MSKIDDVRDYIRTVLDDNIKLNNWISTQEKVSDDKVGDICKDFLQVLEQFEWAEATIHERGLDQSKISTSAITRMLTAKQKLLEVLEIYGVKKVTFPDGMVNPKANIVETVADPEKRDGQVVEVRREGFFRKDKLLRPADVVVVRNDG
ncbi:MAG: nucleotide exchange factor GrpE [Prevotella sp.]|jgi:molecular chaperone GrpE (heat shock protein)|nr:nucleotide exchange factor GrpE [Prevotella sp.]